MEACDNVADEETDKGGNFIGFKQCGSLHIGQDALLSIFPPHLQIHAS